MRRTAASWRGGRRHAPASGPRRDPAQCRYRSDAGWVDRLAAHAAREARIGTITPFSNNATICSYPRFCEVNALPMGETTGSLDGHFASANAGKSIEIPVGVGFCLYIRRECLDEIG